MNFVGAAFQANSVDGTNVTISFVETGAGLGNANLTVGTSAPANARANLDFWWNNDSGKLKLYYNDGTSSQWVDASPANPGPQGPAGPTGPANPDAYNQANAAYAQANAARAAANSSGLIHPFFLVGM